MYVWVDFCRLLIYNRSIIILVIGETKMNSYNRIHTFALLKTLFVNIFSSRYTVVVFDILMTTVISMHTANIDYSSEKWTIKLIVYVVFSILINFLCILAGYIKQKNVDIIAYYHEAYELQNNINCYMATQLYRINKKVSISIRENRIEKNSLNTIIDFQTLSFNVCNHVFSFITSNFNCGDCEITIFQRFANKEGKDFVKMIAYKNSRNNEPTSYNDKFNLSHATNESVPVFVNIFNDLNADCKILHDHKSVLNEFKFFDNSKNREQKICQYIGVPIKTNRNKIEILLQIDVSKERALGKNYNSLKQFTDCILVPISNMLLCSYERDLIFNKFYDILEENLITKEDKTNG